MTKTRLLRGSLAAVAATTLALSAVVLTAPQAQADPLDITCGLTENVTWDPGITFVEQEVEASLVSIYAPCVSLAAPAITSGTASVTAQEETSCATALNGFGGAGTIRWNTGETSTLLLSVTVSHPAGQTVVTGVGTVTAGKFAGSTVVREVTYPSLDAAECLEPEGITNVTGVGFLTINL